MSQDKQLASGERRFRQEAGETGGARMSAILFPSMVREQVLDQHQTLRQLLHRTIEQTTLGLRNAGAQLSDVAQLLHEVRTRFRAHLAFEERFLFPVLARVDGWGPERVTDLGEEHARQRSELDTLLEGFERDGWDLHLLSFALRSLVADLLIDMAHEECACLTVELLGDQIIGLEVLKE
jgi:hypothetical protein